jgi:hypothetical protein
MVNFETPIQGKFVYILTTNPKTNSSPKIQVMGHQASFPLVNFHLS